MRWLGLVLGMVACGGGSYCERLAKQADDCGDPVSDEDLAECEDAMSVCNGDDEKLIDDFVDCMDDAGYFECEPVDQQPTGSTTTYKTTDATEDLAALFACTTPLVALTPECASAFSAPDDAPPSSSYSFTY